MKQNSIFNTVPTAVTPRVNRFDLSHEVLTTGELGNIYPVYSEVLLPNTYKKISVGSVVKTMPMFRPIFSGVEISFAAFAVPIRLLWKDFNDWIYDPSNLADTMPFIKESDLWTIMLQAGNKHSLAGDFDIPVIQSQRGYLREDSDCKDRPITIQDFLAYHLIYQEYFRTEYIDSESSINQDDTRQDYSDWIQNADLSSDTYTQNTYEYFIKHRRVEYERDYFTSALPSTQMGTQSFINILAQTQAPVNFFPEDRVSQWSSMMPPATWYVNVNADQVFPQINPPHFDQTDPQSVHYDVAGNPSYQTSAVGVKAYADLTAAATGLTVGDFRTLFATQAYLEQLMQAGGRYTEGTLSFYGARVSDFRAQIPEFIGLNTMYMAPQEVVAHDAGELGQLGAFGQAMGSGRSFRYYATEHTVLQIVMFMRPKSLYMQGLPKKFRLSDQLDFPLQIFQHLGEEVVKNEELFYQGSSDDFNPFGYQSRFAAWRSSRDRVRGDFAGSLKDWHLARIFDKLPTLSPDFLEVTGDENDYIGHGDQLNRVFNYTGKTDHFIVDIYFKVPAKLPLQYHSKPMIIG